VDFGQPNTTIFLSTNDESEMEKPFKDINLDALDFKLSLIPIVNKVDDQDSFLSEIPEEVFEPNEE
jgi:hypothetical protein